MDIVLTILKDLWLDDWHKTVLLADGTVSGKTVGGLSDSKVGWEAITNFEDGSPLSKSATQFVVLSASLAKVIETLSGSLSISTTDNLKTLVDLNTAVDASASQQVTEALAIFAGITDGLVEHDDARYVLLDIWGGEEELTIGLSILVVVLNANVVKSLTNGAGGLIGSEDTLSWGTNLLGGLDKFFLELS